MYSQLERSLDNDLPTVVLFSEKEIKGDGWEMLRPHSCGGFSCYSLEGWAYLIPVRSELHPFISSVTDEEFCANCSNTSMDYSGSHAELREQQSAYCAYVGQYGLTVNEDVLARLQQAAYPLDATSDNLRILTGDDKLSKMQLDGLRVLILGHNCD